MNRKIFTEKHRENDHLDLTVLSRSLIESIPAKGLNKLTTKGVEQVICTTALSAHI